MDYLSPLQNKLDITPPNIKNQIDPYLNHLLDSSKLNIDKRNTPLEDDSDLEFKDDISDQQLNQWGSNQNNKNSDTNQDGNQRTPSKFARKYSLSNDNNQITEDEKKSLLKKRKQCGLIEGCDSIENYIHLNKIHEGVYGIVFRAKDKINGQIYAIKKVKLNKDNKEGFPVTSIREINLLLSINHPNIVKLKEIVVGSNLDKIYVVMEYMEHELKDLMEYTKYQFSQSEIKCLIKQLLTGMEFLHQRYIIHRDMKPSNLLYNNKGILKICDFGLARKIISPEKHYTPTVVTLWYRAPEVLLGNDQYTQAIDIWSIGCIFAELILKKPLFMGENETQLVDLIFRLCGTPSDESWPGWRQLKFAKNLNFSQKIQNNISETIPKGLISDQGVQLLKEMLALDPTKRISASKALKHPWFKEAPLDCEIENMPSFPPMNEISREARRQLKKD